MSALNRSIRKAIWGGKLAFADGPYPPRFAKIESLELVLPFTGRWVLYVGPSVLSIPLSLLTHTYIELCRTYHVKRTIQKGKNNDKLD